MNQKKLEWITNLFAIFAVIVSVILMNINSYSKSTDDIYTLFFAFGLICIFFMFFCVSLNYKLLISLFFAFAFIDISPIQTNGTYVRIYQIIGVILIIKLFLQNCTHKLKIHINVYFILLNIWLFATLLSFFNAIDIKQFAVIIFGQVFLNLIYLIIYNYVIESKYDKIIFLSWVKWFIIGGFFVVEFGILQLLMGILGINIISFKEGFGDLLRPRSFLNEPVWYGTVCGYMLLYCIINLLFNNYELFTKRILIINAFFCFIGLVLSMGRASWIAFAVSIFVLFFHNYKLILSAKNIKKIITSVVVIFLGIASINFVYPVAFDALKVRLSLESTASTNYNSISSRTASLSLAKDMFLESPIIGFGLGGLSYKSGLSENWSKYNNGRYIQGGRGNVNVFMTNLADTGVVGTVFFLILLSYIVWKSFRIIDISYRMFAILPVIYFMINFLSSNGIRLGFVWFHFTIAMILALNKFEGQTNKNKIIVR